ncbi:hypothetical protein F383_29117 [Gossypium arboreum]|uniref:Uncharacterized protein n=1 Tax=Gossypium arboreum TaxID=29729 RepID=A0A0B0PHQ4_GOSAR|nr:hypothetical protein F383_29117 [Gossypium arboreum]
MKVSKLARTSGIIGNYHHTIDYSLPIFVHTSKDTGVCLIRERHTVMLYGRVFPGIVIQI